MKKNIFKYLALALLAGCFCACEDVNDKFDGFDELTKPQNLRNDTITLAEKDYQEIIKKLDKKDPAEAEIATFIQAQKAFPTIETAEAYLPRLIASLYPTASEKSSVYVYYDYIKDRDENLAALTGDDHVVSTDEYKTVWGAKSTDSFTPKRTAEKNLSKILKAAYPSATDKEIKNVSYFYSKDEPVDVTVVGQVYLEEKFEGMGVAVNDPVKVTGWINKDLTGDRSWQTKDFDGNTYAQATSYKASSANDVWLITSKQAIANKADMQLTFDVKVGNHNGDCLTVWVSSDFDGTEANIASATWTDITSKFTIPSVPAKGYGEWESPGNCGLDAYKGQNVYFAFRYQGDPTGNTTTYQIDNVKVYEGVPGIDVEEKEVQYAMYQYDLASTSWKPYTERNTIHLQPSDYTEIGLQKPIIDAKNLGKIPLYLAQKYPFELDGSTKVVVYKPTAETSFANSYTFTKGVWVPKSTKVEKGGQFLLTADGWKFDPTLLVVFGAAEYQVVVNYVVANQATTNSALVPDTKDVEYFYGFSAKHKNVSYREKDRSNDPIYDALGTIDEKVELMNKRTIEGIEVFLKSNYPTATPTVSGIEQFAEVEVYIYMNPKAPANETWTYRLQCIGTGQWKPIHRKLVGSNVVEKFE